MLARLTFAPMLMLFGVVLGVVGLVLWKCLPIATAWPPFGLTALVAIACGMLDWLWERRRPTPVEKP